MWAISISIIKLAFITILGFILYKKSFIQEQNLKFLSLFVIYIAMPCLFFSRLVEKSEIVLSHPVYIFLFWSFIIFFAGAVMGFLFSFRKGKEVRREFCCSIGLQNSGYLPMNIIYLLFAGALKEELLVYIFLYLLGFNIIMWSIGTFLIFRKRGEAFHWKVLFTPPVVATLLALLFVYTGFKRFIPEFIIFDMNMLGETAFVLSLIVLGCWLARIRLENIYKHWAIVTKACVLKMILLPLLFLVGLIQFKITGLLGFFIFMQVTMPVAVSLPIVLHLKEADSEFVSQIVFLSHIIGIVSIPLWLSLYLKMTGLALL